jgi:hypothetical protein
MNTIKMPQPQPTTTHLSSVPDSHDNALHKTNTPMSEVQARSDRSSADSHFEYRSDAIERARVQTAHKQRNVPSGPWKLVRLGNQTRVAVVGESFYQPALIAITGRSDWVEVQYPCMALLVLEPRNPHDPNAVRVEIKRQLVGYLSRADAVSYGPNLRLLARNRRLPCCEALISGRGPGSSTKNMGVFLYMPAPGLKLV